MKTLAICGSYRRQGVIHALMEEVAAGVRAVMPEAEIETIQLTERKIAYCRGCMRCYGDDPAKPIADCVIRDDDMAELARKLDAADGYIFGTPIFCGTVTAVMKTFCERFAYVLGRPGKRPLPGCPTPRTSRRKAAVLVMSTAVVPRLFRWFCDDATKFFREILPCTLNARMVGSLYAGKARAADGPGRGENFAGEARALGGKLARALARLG